ncbi:hypothetical protein [Pseudogemmobacter faecipullorum]|uniref:Uncharacterized protein n=1 Tax=Pseudogemmobacter faecipullorum TaxID=2755041 RepID=A0ABS8CT06_9RHOB|nr:hypothetical protein [Pseudogemmobacter faecipullorum]MCB5412333.1 hypothetical protein [Pseudogemmobacter faecipullorum]
MRKALHLIIDSQGNLEVAAAAAPANGAEVLGLCTALTAEKDLTARRSGAFTLISRTIVATESQQIAREAMMCEEDKTTVLEAG